MQTSLVELNEDSIDNLISYIRDDIIAQTDDNGVITNEDEVDEF